MAKRMTDSEKWKDPWFSELPNDYKLIWLYILDNCDNAGIYKVSLRHLHFDCNTNVSKDDIINVLKDRIYKISEEKWFVKKFCDFQYGDNFLQSKNKAVISAINKLDKQGLLKVDDKGNYTLYIPYQYPMDTPKEKEKEKFIDKFIDKDKEKDLEKEFEELEKIIN